MTNNYEWDKYEVDEAFAKLASREFADPKNGVPEWVKNSNDAYIRADKSKGQRPITIIYSPNSKDYGTPVIACLDLVGMTIDDLSILKRWGDPAAAGYGTGITGGHGNGGKSYSIAGFSGPTIYYTLKDSFANVYGFPEPPRPVTAWLPNGKNVKIENSLEYLESALSQIGLMPSDLPDEIQKQLPNVHGFTLLVGHCPKDFTGKFLANWTNILQNHKEMFITLQNCEIYVISNRRLLNNGKPLTLESVLPMEKYKDPLIIDVPSELMDPESGKVVSTIGDGSFPPGEVVLRTMEKRIYQFHRIDYIQKDRIVGTRPVRDFVGQSHWTDYIYGSCTLPSLTEEYVGNLRGLLVDRPLTRSLNNWIGDQIITWAHEMEKAAAKESLIEVTKEKRRRIIQQMETLNKLKDSLLEEMAGGIGEEDGGGGGKKPRRSPVPLLDLPVSVVRIASEGEVGGRLVEMPLTINFYGDDGQEVRPVAVIWYSQDPAIARVNVSRGVIVTDHEGNTEIWCETKDGLKSNKIPVRVVDCKEIELVPDKLDLGIGRRTKIRAFGHTASGEEVPDIRLFWQSSDKDIAIVGQHGIVTGIAEGTAEVSAMEGDGTKQIVAVKVIPSPGGGRGPQKPQFLMSEIQTAWYMTEPKRLSHDQPLVVQDAIDADNNVWWINLKSPMAEYIYNKHSEGSEVWAVYLAERFADGLAEAALTSDPERGSESRAITDVLLDVALKRKEFVQRFIEEYCKAGQIAID